jgi:hypothetical protein
VRTVQNNLRKVDQLMEEGYFLCLTITELDSTVLENVMCWCDAKREFVQSCLLAVAVGLCLTLKAVICLSLSKAFTKPWATYTHTLEDVYHEKMNMF